ncbi:MAG: PD40 domain-containing protein [Myxococcales bacterium]|nr:PD40 domain-containing protein [Myxococcales bacterium]
MAGQSSLPAIALMALGSIVVGGAALGSGCAASKPAASTAVDIPAAPLSSTVTRKLEQRVQVFFRAGKAYARERGREWQIAEVGRDELRWAPNGVLFAYVNERAGRAEVVVRNVRGDSVNAFPIYRAGLPSGLDWIDDRQIAYLAPPDKTGPAYVVHAARSGEVLFVHRGRQFTWSPDRKRLAYVAGKQHIIKVGSERVWPREEPTRRARRHVFSQLVWSPDGKGLAFMERHRGIKRLVVMLVIDDKGGDLTWRLPPGASAPSNKLFWAGNKLIIGESKFKPRFAANWTRVR